MIFINSTFAIEHVYKFPIEISYLLDAALELLADESFHLLGTRPIKICINATKSVMTNLKNTFRFFKAVLLLGN